MSHYKHLLEPASIRHLKLKNRMVKPAQWLVYAEADGSVGERAIAFYETIAKGGVGLVTVEESICDFPQGASAMPHIRLDDDKFLPGLTRLAQAIHSHDARAIVQITHAGPAHNPLVGGEAIAPSRLEPPAEPVFAIAHELTKEEIAALVEKFAQAALRVKNAGFDGVELHMAHYALINAFLSRVQNKRSDEYGAASLETRSRFSREILKRARALCGEDFIIGIRMSNKEWGHELGTTNAEAVEFAKIFETNGADYIQVSAYGYGAYALCALPELVTYPEVPAEVKDFADRIPHGALVPETEAIKKAVKIPVSAVGYLDPKAAEKVLKDGKADLICFGRRLMADPELPLKLAAGREDEIRPCLRCNVCLSDILLAQPARCRINPFMGNEATLKISPAAKQKTVMIVGAGPAGMEAARVAAERGHHVMLYDKSADLGGLVPMASFIKGAGVADNLMKMVPWYRHEFKRLGVELHLGVQVDAELVNLLEPDALVLALGGKPVLPKIAGIDSPNVITTENLKKSAAPYLHLLGSKLMSALTKVYLPVKDSVAIIGGDLAGLEAAEFFIKRGRKVTIVETGPQPGAGMPLVWLVRLMPWLAAKNVAMHVGVKIDRITGEGVEITGADGKTAKIAAETVMVMPSYERNDQLDSQFGKLKLKPIVVGDALGGAPRYIQGAILDGAKAGAEV
ncbi:MAG: FAD-dependent oxidoreductase [Turneriella sp.]